MKLLLLSGEMQACSTRRKQGGDMASVDVNDGVTTAGVYPVK
jgi:hypothetical protein